MKRITVELPDGVMVAFVNYVYATESGLLIGSTAIDTDALARGFIACKGSENYEVNNERLNKKT